MAVILTATDEETGRPCGRPVSRCRGLGECRRKQAIRGHVLPPPANGVSDRSGRSCYAIDSDS